MNPYGCDEWQDVSSSNIKAVGRKGDDLIIKFHNAVYLYKDAGDYFDDLITSDSVGKFFHSTIRDLPCSRITMDEGL